MTRGGVGADREEGDSERRDEGGGRTCTLLGAFSACRLRVRGRARTLRVSARGAFVGDKTCERGCTYRGHLVVLLAQSLEPAHRQSRRATTPNVGCTDFSLYRVPRWPDVDGCDIQSHRTQRCRIRWPRPVRTFSPPAEGPLLIGGGGKDALADLTRSSDMSKKGRQR